MQKSKLTLYVDKKTSRMAHRAAKLSGKSISSMVKDLFGERERRSAGRDISPEVERWIGVTRTRLSYKELREEHVATLIKKHDISTK